MSGEPLGPGEISSLYFPDYGHNAELDRGKGVANVRAGQQHGKANCKRHRGKL